MILRLKSAEINIGTANTVSEASVVRLYNSDTAAHLVIVVETGYGFTMPGGSISFVDKLPTQNLQSDANVRATSVAYNIS